MLYAHIPCNYFCILLVVLTIKLNKNTTKGNSRSQRDIQAKVMKDATGIMYSFYTGITKIYNNDRSYTKLLIQDLKFSCVPGSYLFLLFNN